VLLLPLSDPVFSCYLVSGRYAAVAAAAGIVVVLRVVVVAVVLLLLDVCRRWIWRYRVGRTGGRRASVFAQRRG